MLRSIIVALMLASAAPALAQPPWSPPGDHRDWYRQQAWHCRHAHWTQDRDEWREWRCWQRRDWDHDRDRRGDDDDWGRR